MKKSNAILLLLLTTLLWSTGGVLIKWVTWSPLAIAGWRSLLAGCLLWAIFPKTKFSFHKYSWGAAFSYAATVILFVVATKWTTAANAVLLQYTAPFYIAIFGGWFLGEKANKEEWLLMGLALMGMVLFFRDDLSTQNIYGNILGLLSGFTFAWMVLFLRKQKSDSNLSSIIMGNGIAALFCMPAMVQVDAVSTNWALVVFLATVQMAAPYYCYAKAIQYVPALEAIMIQLIEPILNPLWVLLLYQETPGAMALAGGTLVVLSVALKPILLKLKGKSAKPSGCAN